MQKRMPRMLPPGKWVQTEMASEGELEETPYFSLIAV